MHIFKFKCLKNNYARPKLQRLLPGIRTLLISWKILLYHCKLNLKRAGLCVIVTVFATSNVIFMLCLNFTSREMEIECSICGVERMIMNRST